MSPAKIASQLSTLEQARSHYLLTAEAKAPSALLCSVTLCLHSLRDTGHFADSPSSGLVVKHDIMGAGEPVKGESHLEVLRLP